MHNRHSIRIKGYDYSSIGYYFLTIGTKNREYLFGEIVDREMRLNEIGNIVQDEWLKTASIRENVEMDQYIVMPNHFHAVLHIHRRGVLQYAPTHVNQRTVMIQPFQSPSQTIGAIVRGFKSTVTKRINQRRNMPGIPIWQRNYYERVIKNEVELTRTRQYILDNPKGWELDPENK